MKDENKENAVKLSPEELKEVSGGVNPEYEAKLRSIGQFRINEYPAFGLGNTEAAVPANIGLNIGDKICICSVNYETKIVKKFYDLPETRPGRTPVIIVGLFHSKDFGQFQEVKVWER